MQMQNKKIFVIFVVVVALILCGCAAKTPMMPERADVAAKRFMPPPNKANLYITRTSNLGFAILFKLYLDGELAGSIAPSTYLLFELEPGKHQIAVITAENQDAVTIDFRDGENYFIDVIPKFGWMQARAELKELSPEEGTEAVMEAKRAEALAISQ